MNLNDLKPSKKVLVIGHKKPDTDTILSSYLMKKILNFFDIDAEYCIIDGEFPDDGSMKMINAVITYNPFRLKINDVNNYEYFLVDHNDVTQSILDSNLVLGGIDHHVDSNKCKNIYFTDYCSTTLGIYALFKDIYSFSDEEKKIIFMGVIDDSSFGKSCRYKDKDESLLKELGLGEDLSSYFDKYFIPTNLDDTEFAFNNNGLKKYDFGDIKLKSVYIEAVDTNRLMEFVDFIKNNNENIYGLWIDFKNEISYTYLKYDNLYYEKTYDFVVSRATVGINDTLEYIRRNL